MLCVNILLIFIPSDLCQVLPEFKHQPTTKPVPIQVHASASHNTKLDKL